MWRPWNHFYLYTKMLSLEIEKMHFWSRAPCEISSCPSVKSTRASCFMVRRRGGEEVCDPQAFRANLLSVLYGSVLIEV